jgi:hypothetical protein
MKETSSRKISGVIATTFLIPSEEELSYENIKIVAKACRT